MTTTRQPGACRVRRRLRSRHLPDEVRRKLGSLLLDFLRVSSFGARLPWSGWARDYVAIVGRAGASHVLFSPETLNPQHATFLNVSFGSSYDADDTHVGAMLHPGVAVWSAALATAEHVGASGPEMLAAVVAGYETIIRIGLSMQPGHFRRGFQSTGTCDVFGTAAAAGRLLFRGRQRRGAQDHRGDRACGQLPVRRRAVLLLGLVRQTHPGGAFGAMRSRGSAAHAEGFSGPPDILEGTGGFARAYGDGFNASVIESGLGSASISWTFSPSRTRPPRASPPASTACWRCASSTALQLTISLRSARHPAHHRGPAHQQASGRLAGRADVPAVQRRGRRAGAAHDACPGPVRRRFRGRPVRPRLHGLEERTTIALDDEVEAASNDLSTAARVSVTLTDGRALSMLVPASKGSPAKPFTDAEQEERFTRELSTRIPARAAPRSSRWRTTSIASIRAGSAAC